MPEERLARLVIEINGELPVYRYRDFLTAIDFAYNYLFVGTEALEDLARGQNNLASMFADEKKKLARLVPVRNRLILDAAEFHSPGIFSLKGSGEIVEQIRLYLQDRHTRRQDREIREPADRRRLELENQIKETDLIRARIAAARDAGASEDDLQMIRHRMFGLPLRGLDAYQDHNVIASASIEDAEVDSPDQAHLLGGGSEDMEDSN